TSRRRARRYRPHARARLQTGEQISTAARAQLRPPGAAAGGKREDGRVSPLGGPGSLAVRIFTLFLAALLGACTMPGTAPLQVGESRHEGYYYPPISSSEVYNARAATLED